MVSEKLLEPRYVNLSKNKAYCYEGLGHELNIMEVDLETLETKDYERKESGIVINEFEIDPNFKSKAYMCNDQKNTFITISPDDNKALIADNESIRIIKNFPSYQK